MGFAYRDADEGARLRRDALLAYHRRAAARAAGADLAGVYARRIARAAAGAVLAAGAIALVAVAVTEGSVYGRDSNAAAVIVAAWIGALAAYGAAHLWAWGWFRARARARFVPSADVHADVARLEAADPGAERIARVDRLELASVALPLSGLALLAPLSLHLLFMTFFLDGPDRFGGWVLISAILVGHAHLALVVCCVLFAVKLRKLGALEMPDATAWAGWKAWGITVGVSAVPGAVLYLIPPALVAVTGVLFIPLAFTWMRTSILRERLALVAGERVERVQP